MLKKYILGIILLSFLLIAGCSSNATEKQVTVADVTDSSGEIVDVKVKAFRFGFEPNTIKVKQGQTVRLTAESIDVPHGLAIPKYGINLYLDGSKSQTVEFKADQAGNFPMFCSVPCGSGHGSMRGTFIVE